MYLTLWPVILAVDGDPSLRVGNHRGDAGYFSGMKTKTDPGTTKLPVERLFTPRGQPIGKIVRDLGSGRLRGYNARGEPAGSFDPRTKKTTDARGQPFGVGNLLPALVMECRCPCLVGGRGRPIAVK